MSQQKIYPISCPTCGERMEVNLYDSVNVQAEPDRRLELMANELNAVSCPACGFQFRVDKPLLYNDPAQQILIYWVPTAQDQVEDGEREFRSQMRRFSQWIPDDVVMPDMHLVFSRSELVERIFLLEAELNPRIIEYIKYSIYIQNMEQVDPLEKALLFDAEDSTDESLCFVVQDSGSHKLESLLQYSRQAYQGLCEMFDQDDQTASLLELFPGPYISARTLLLRESQV